MRRRDAGAAGVRVEFITVIDGLCENVSALEGGTFAWAFFRFSFGTSESKIVVYYVFIADKNGIIK